MGWGGFPSRVRLSPRRTSVAVCGGSRDRGDPRGTPAAPLLLPVRLRGAKKWVQARTRQPWPLLSSNTAAAEGGRHTGEDVRERTAPERGSSRCQGHGSARGCVPGVLRHVCRAGGGATRGSSGSGCEGAAHAVPGLAGCASERHCRPALPHRCRLFLALFIISPPALEMKTKPLQQGRPPGRVAAPGERGWRGRRGGVRGGCGAGSALTLSRQGMLRGALGSAIGCPGRLRDYLWCAGRGSALAPLPARAAGPDVPRHGGLFRKISGKVGQPASCQEGGCAAQGMVWKWHGVMVLGRVVMLGCWGRSLYRGNSEVKPAIFKWNYFSCDIYCAVWLQLGAVAAWVGATPSLQGCARAAARGSWGTSLGGVCLVCSSWKIHPGARITCLVWASWSCAEGCAVVVTHMCHTGGVQCPASPSRR